MRIHRNGGGNHHTIQAERAHALETIDDGLAGGTRAMLRALHKEHA
jgi:hypothetical protein